MPLLRSLFVSFALVAAVAPASSQGVHDGPHDAAIARDAAAAITTYLEGVQQSGGRPDYTKPPVSGLFHQVFNLEELKALPPATPSDLPWLLDWTGAANRVNILMTIFGTPAGGPVDPLLIKRNQTDYEDQCVTAMNFMIRLEARDASALTGFMAQLTPEQRTPVRDEGLQRSRKGATELIVGAAIWIAQGMKPANARLLTASLRDTKDVWAQYVMPDDRPGVVSVLKALQSSTKDDEVRKNVAALSAALTAAK